jgi:AraC family transcriptional regulator, positive regulator of tynA and feaB
LLRETIDDAYCEFREGQMLVSQVRRPPLTYNEWQGKLQMLGARYQLRGIDGGNFRGWLGERNICGFEAIDLSCNATRFERTRQDTSLDKINHYYLLFQRTGQMQLEQNNRTSVLNTGDVALIDSSRPITYLSRPPHEWLSLHLDRKSLVSHLGFEPQGGQSRSGAAPAAMLLRQLALDDAAIDQPSTTESKQASAYMRLAVFDLVGALFSDPAQASKTPYSDKLFLRACDIIRDRFKEPDFGPSKLAAEMRISLRYLQALFAVRGSTCGKLIQSSRLDYAINLLHRRALLGNSSALREIAHASGFLDYNYFARLFRRRYGRSPGAQAYETSRSPIGSHGVLPPQ